MDFVTVCFKNDLPQMSLQAASMDKFLRDFPVDRIIVILNDDTDAARSYFHDNVWPLYGHLIERVVLVNHSAMTDHRILPCPHCKIRNQSCTYCYQQLLKLSGAKLAASDRICVLDSKNWLNRPWQLEDIVDDSGRMRISYHQGDNEQWIYHWRNSMNHYGVEDKSMVVNLTPFFVYTDVALSIVIDDDLLIKWDHVPLGEFYLVQAATIKKYGSIAAVYYETSTFMNSIWPFTMEQLDMDAMIGEFIEPKQQTLVSGLHRRCYAMLTDKNRSDLIANYARLGLLDQQKTQDLIDQMIALNQ